MSDVAVLQNMIEFMKRVNLSGKEVPAYNDCINYLINQIDEQGKTNGKTESETTRSD